MNRLINYQLTKAQLKNIKELRGFGSNNTLTIKIPLKALLRGKNILVEMYPFSGDLNTINSVGITDAMILTCYLNHLVNEKSETHAYFIFLFSVKTKLSYFIQVDSE